MFRTVPLSIFRSFLYTHSKGICHTGLLTACEQAVSKSLSCSVAGITVRYSYEMVQRTEFVSVFLVAFVHINSKECFLNMDNFLSHLVELTQYGINISISY
jgi:hypothetical protein